MKVMQNLFGIVLAMFLSAGAFAQVANTTWYNQEKTAKIQLYDSNGKIAGKITWLKEPNDENGKPKTDPENKDPKLRTRSRLGMVMVWGFKANGTNYWDGGNIYDPRSGKTYSCNMTLQADGSLKLRGYVGISAIGKTQIWTKAN